MTSGFKAPVDPKVRWLVPILGPDWFMSLQKRRVINMGGGHSQSALFEAWSSRGRAGADLRAIRSIPICRPPFRFPVLLVFWFWELRCVRFALPPRCSVEGACVGSTCR